LMQSDPVVFPTGVFRWLAIPFRVTGTAVLLWCAWAFIVRRHGTPFPTDPLKELVVSGYYRYIRNPIYLSVLVVFMGYALWYPSRPILLCPPIVALISHLFVIFYEELNLPRPFVVAYECNTILCKLDPTPLENKR
jgi:protein-S-isoprenylcysteine O-methyltransferase Ste14